MSDLPDRLWAAAYEQTPPPEELRELLVEAASQIVQDAWWRQTFRDMWARRSAGQSGTPARAPEPPREPE